MEIDKKLQQKEWKSVREWEQEKWNEKSEKYLQECEQVIFDCI